MTKENYVNFSLKIISTHTLTWSVTNILEQHTYTIEISTHTLTWSVTVFGKKAYKPRKYFNSHAHVERDERNKQKEP